MESKKAICRILAWVYRYSLDIQITVFFRQLERLCLLSASGHRPSHRSAAIYAGIAYPVIFLIRHPSFRAVKEGLNQVVPGHSAPSTEPEISDCEMEWKESVWGKTLDGARAA
eukprot:2295601-Rhodomonas_salina.1